MEGGRCTRSPTPCMSSQRQDAGFAEVSEHLLLLVNAHQQIVLVGFVLSTFLHVFFITPDLDSQGSNLSLQGAGVLQVFHDLAHQLPFLDF